MHIGERFDQHVDFAPAAQPNRPGKVIADPVVKQGGRFAFEDGLRLFEDLALETSTADRPRDLSGLADGHPRPGWARRAPPGTDDGRDRYRIAGVEPGLDIAHDIAHVSKCSFVRPLPAPASAAGPGAGSPSRAAARRAPRDWRGCAPAGSRRQTA